MFKSVELFTLFFGVGGRRWEVESGQSDKLIQFIFRFLLLEGCDQMAVGLQTTEFQYLAICATGE